MSGIIEQLTEAGLTAQKRTFWVFDQNTLRERPARVGAEKSLSPADYLLVMQQTIRTNDIENEEIHSSYSLLSGVSLSPGLDSQCLFPGGDTSTLYAAMKAGIFLPASRCHGTLLIEGSEFTLGRRLILRPTYQRSQHFVSITLRVCSHQWRLI